jgi:hypothetical protein
MLDTLDRNPQEALAMIRHQMQRQDTTGSLNRVDVQANGDIIIHKGSSGVYGGHLDPSLARQLLPEQNLPNDALRQPSPLEAQRPAAPMPPVDNAIQPPSAVDVRPLPPPAPLTNDNMIPPGYASSYDGAPPPQPAPTVWDTIPQLDFRMELPSIGHYPHEYGQHGWPSSARSYARPHAVYAPHSVHMSGQHTQTRRGFVKQ